MTYTATLTTEQGPVLLTNDGSVLLAESDIPIVPYAPYPDPAISPTDYPILKRGVNLSGWYTLHGQNLIDSRDVAQIKAAGFDHVRLNVAPGWTDPLPSEGGPSEPVGIGWSPYDAEGAIPGIATVDAGVELCLTAGLAVIIDTHTTNTNDNERLLDPYFHSSEADPASYVLPYQDSYVAMWRNIATHYKDYPQNVLAYEIFNEPAFYGWETNWFDFRNRIVAAIREVDSLHFIISPLPRGGGTGYLWRNENVADAGHGFAVHSYEPFDFTHRLTDWTGISNKWNWVLNLKYPSSAMDGVTPDERPLYKADSVTQGAFDAYLAGIGYPADIPAYISAYIAANWTTGSYDWIANYVADYGAPRGNTRMFINEFGAFKPDRPMKAVYDPDGGYWSHPWHLLTGEEFIDVDQPSRSAYLSDTRKAWEGRTLGWTAFDYAGNFGITDLTGDTYWRDNGEHCPMYGGSWQRSFTLSNLNALLVNYMLITLTITPQDGGVLDDVSVTVYLHNTSTKASIYTDASLETPVDNPFVTSAEVNTFYVLDDGASFDFVVDGGNLCGTVTTSYIGA